MISEFNIFVTKLNKKNSQDTIIINLNKEKVSELLIVYPSKAEQKKIAEKLSDIDKLISTLEKQIEKKRSLKQGIMQILFTKSTRLPGFNQEWNEFVFGDVFDFVPNNAFTRTQMTDSGKVKNIHYGDILTKYGAYIKADNSEIPYIVKEIDLTKILPVNDGDNAYTTKYDWNT